MYYTVYKVTNTINGKVYIGRHRTDNLNDGYFASGVLINHAVKKYGRKNFEREIIHFAKDFDDMKRLELEEIEKHHGSNCYNLSMASNGSEITSEETKKKISKSLTGYVRTEENKRKISEGSKGKVMSAESRKKMSESLRGRKQSAETIIKRANKLRGMKKRPHTEEAKKRISESKKGYKMSDEWKENISKSLKGKVVSEETKERMREAWKKRKLK